MSTVTSRFSKRHRTLWGSVSDRSLDALLVTHLPNVAYLTGLRASGGAALVSAEGIQLLTDSRYLSVATALAESDSAPTGLQVVPVQRSYDEAIQIMLVNAGISRVGIESDHVTVRRLNWLTESLKDTDVTLVPVEGLIEAGRLVKDAYEIECFRRGGKLIAQAVGPILDRLRQGRSEREIAAEIDFILAMCGFEDRAFPTIVASGPNSALPHARPSNRCLAAGDLVLLDFGGVYDGYCVDLSRTICVGQAAEQVARLHEAVLDAHQAAVAVVRPGIVASEIDAVARLRLARYELAEAFGHSTGHGLGLEIHEAPRIGRTEQASADVIVKPGMVFTIEPGVYKPGVGGVRIEDDVLVTETGCEVLTEAPRELTAGRD